MKVFLRGQGVRQNIKAMKEAIKEAAEEATSQVNYECLLRQILCPP
jgi:hypothetical protein